MQDEHDGGNATTNQDEPDGIIATTKPLKNANKILNKRQGVKKAKLKLSNDGSVAEDSNKEDSVYKENDEIESDDSAEETDLEDEEVIKPNNKHL